MEHERHRDQPWRRWVLPAVGGALVLVAIALAAGVSLGNVLLFGLFLACPLMHLFGGHQHGHGHGTTSQSPKGEPTQVALPEQPGESSGQSLPDSQTHRGCH